MPPIRRSGRSHKPNTKYSDDPFKDLGIPSSGSEDSEARQKSSDSEEDEEFALEPAAEAEAVEEDESSSTEELSDGSGIVTPAEGHANSNTGEESVSAKVDKKVSKRSKWDVTTRLDVRKAKQMEIDHHTRGVTDPGSHGSKLDYLVSLFGTGTKELGIVARSRDQWASDVVLPTKTNQKAGRGLHQGFYWSEEDRAKEAMEGWEWYHKHGGRETFLSMQQIHSLDPVEGLKYVHKSANAIQKFLMGPYGNQKLYELPLLSSFLLDEAWQHGPSAGQLESAGSGRPRKRRRREGWILNVGTCVKCVDWAPNHHGDTQYLAISTLYPGEKPPGSSKPPSAFIPTAGFPSCIQIWAFSVSTSSDHQSTLNPNKVPRLLLVICTEWGDAKQLKWCPIPRNFPPGSSPSLGLLAAIW
ncbi:MAG: hypothetical protein Q9190_007431, partial [Brigantiaea leucoxantha]